MKALGEAALGAVLLVMLHVLVLGAARMADADAPVHIVSTALTLGLGVVQLVYAAPLAWFLRKRRAALGGVAAAVLATGVVNVLGLMN